MDYSIENLKIVTSPYYRAYLPDGRNSYMPVVFCDEYFVDCYINPENFMISNYGRVYSKHRKMMMNFKINTQGYHYYDLMLSDKINRINVRADLLVANTFISNDNLNIKTFLWHNDGNIHNDYYLNLQWVDPNNIPQPNYIYDRSEAIKCVGPDPSIFDYNQFRYAVATPMKGKGFLTQFADEVFKPIIGHPNYLVSNYGRVYTEYKHNILTPRIDKDGYLRVTIDGISKGIHRFVALTFFVPSTPHYGDQVNHIDGNKRNNHISNLEWCTCKENIHHAIKTGLRNLNGERSHFSNHSDAQVEKECKLLELGYNAQNIAYILGLEWNTRYSDHITKLRRGETCKHISSKYNIPRYSSKGYENMNRSNASLKNRDFKK